MAYRLEFHPEAEAEFDEAITWYQEKRDGLEQEFFDDFLVLESRLEENPSQFPAVLDNKIRRANFHRFPYSIVFEIEQGSIFIYAVFHQSRNPDDWNKRM